MIKLQLSPKAQDCAGRQSRFDGPEDGPNYGRAFALKPSRRERKFLMQRRARKERLVVWQRQLQRRAEVRKAPFRRNKCRKAVKCRKAMRRLSPTTGWWAHHGSNLRSD